MFGNKTLLTTISLLSLTSFYNANANILNPTGSNALGDGTDTVTSNNVTLGNSLTSQVTMNSKFFLNTNGQNINGGDFSAITTSTKTTNATAITIGQNSLVSANADIDVIDIQNKIGSITNLGTISGVASGDGIFINATVATIENSGLIESAVGSAIGISADNTTEITNSGSIISHNDGVGINITASLNGKINNSGLVQSTNGYAIILGTSAEISKMDNNVISNSGTIQDTGSGTAILINTNVGKIENNGLISSSGGSALYFNEDGTADLTNSGTINSGLGGIAIDASLAGSSASSGILLTNSGNIIGSIFGNSVLADTLNLNNGNILGDIDLGGNDNDRINFGSSTTDKFTTAGNITANIIDIKAGTLTIRATDNITLQGANQLVNVGDGTAIAFEIINSANYGKITGEDFTINGSGALQVTTPNIGYIADGTRLTTFTGTSLTGVSDDLVLADTSLIYKFTQKINGNNIDILVNRENSFTSMGSGNGAAAGSALEIIGNGGDIGLQGVNKSLSNMNSKGQVSSSLDSLTPDVSGMTTQGVTSLSDASVATVENRMESSRDALSSGIVTGNASNTRGIWGEVFGSAIDQSDRNGIAGYQADILGFTLGTDFTVNDNARTGIAFSYGNTDADGTNINTDIDSYQIAAYGSMGFHRLYIEGLVAAAANRYETDRTLFEGSVANANFDGDQYTGKGKVGYNINLYRNVLATPFASLQYMHINLEDYTESGSNANLTVANNDVEALKSGLGAKLAAILNCNSHIFKPNIYAGWYHDLIADEVIAVSNFTSAAATQFTSEGASMARNALRAGAGMEMFHADNMSVSFNYDFETRSDFNAHGGTVKARWEF